MCKCKKTRNNTGPVAYKRDAGFCLTSLNRLFAIPARQLSKHYVKSSATQSNERINKDEK